MKEEIRPIKIRNIERIILYQKKVEKQRAFDLVEDQNILAQEKAIRTEIGITDEEVETAAVMEKHLFKNIRLFIDAIKSGTVESDNEFGGSTQKKCTDNKKDKREKNDTPVVKQEFQKRVAFIQDRPKWLQALLLGSKSHATQVRRLQRKLQKLECSEHDQSSKDHIQDEICYLKNRLKDITVTPKQLNYEEWSRHLQIVPSSLAAVECHYYRDNSSNRDNYYRYDTLGWSKGEGYIMGLSSPVCDMNAQEIYNVSS